MLAGLFAPLVANAVPLVARVDGRWSFPAFAELVGESRPGPDDQTWKQWWSRLPATSSDFVIMPPWPYGPSETEAQRARQGPSVAHPCGCDDTGRDVLARLVHGMGTVVLLGVPAVVLAGLIGTLLGAWAGWRGGIADLVLTRLIEIFVCLPTLLFLLFASTFLGASSLGFVLVLAALFWTSFARIVRGEMLSLRERDFVHTARGLGVSEWRIVTGHLLPQVWSQVGVTAAFCMASACVAESTLSFLGFGFSGTGCSWGTMLRQGAELAVVGAWHLWLFPALALVALVVSCHLFADRLRQCSAS
jgi:peptide/nickel transport system permease protein